MNQLNNEMYLQVSDNGTYLTRANVPFFWMGDTAWLLFQKLTIEEAYCYLRNRKEKGYNVILADFIHSMNQPNVYCDYPLHNNDLRYPDQESNYWKHIDQILDYAKALDLYMVILPVWGSSLVKGGNLTADNVKDYMDFVIDRYRSCTNIVWLVGGDVRGDVNEEVFHTMGNMLKENNPAQLVGYHPFGRTSSSQWFHSAIWLDFNMFQSGHRRYDQASLGAWDDNAVKDDYFGEDNWRYVQRDLLLLPKKPTIDGEPSYEQILQGLHDESQPYWLAKDIRRYAYWSVFEGAFGFTYGHNSIMQFYKDPSVKGAFGAKALWQDALHHPGGSQMKHLVDLMNSVDFTGGVAAQHLLLTEQAEKYDRISVFSGDDFIFCYDYSGREFTLDLATYSGRSLDAYWFDPVCGVYSYIREVTNERTLTVKPTSREDSEDFVLVLKVK